MLKTSPAERRGALVVLPGPAGQDGKGNPSVSAFLKVKVPDLTLLKKNNQNIYPEDEVIVAIDGRRKLRSHGDPRCPSGEQALAGSQRSRIRGSERRPKGKSHCRICRHAPAVTLLAKFRLLSA